MTPVCFVLWSLSLGLTRVVLRVLGTLELHLNVSSFAKSFEFVSSVGDVGNNNGGPVLVAVVLAVVGVAGGVGVGCMVGMFEFVFPLVKCPVRELAVV